MGVLYAWLIGDHRMEDYCELRSVIGRLQYPSCIDIVCRKQCFLSTFSLRMCPNQMVIQTVMYVHTLK